MTIRKWFTNPFLWRLFWISWAVLIAILSFIPGDRLPVIEWDLISVDTLVHFLMYATLSFSMILGGFKKNMNLSSFNLYLIILSAGIAYGTGIELIQGFFIYQRYFDPSDILANTIGTIFGAVTVRLTSIKLV